MNKRDYLISEEDLKLLAAKGVMSVSRGSDLVYFYTEETRSQRQIIFVQSEVSVDGDGESCEDGQFSVYVAWLKNDTSYLFNILSDNISLLSLSRIELYLLRAITILKGEQWYMVGPFIESSCYSVISRKKGDYPALGVVSYDNVVGMLEQFEYILSLASVG